MADWGEVLGAIGTVARSIATHVQFGSLLQLERSDAIAYLNTIVQTKSAQDLDTFETEFLQWSTNVFGQEKRIRVMELYAWLKISECAHYNKFRGFPGPPGPLP